MQGGGGATVGNAITSQQTEANGALKADNANGSDGGVGIVGCTSLAAGGGLIN